MDQLREWGLPYDCPVSEAVAVIVAELAANAVTHGRIPGRDFELRLSLVTGSVRVEVSDTRAEPVAVVRSAGRLDDGGRGLLLVEALADRWEVVERESGPGKTVRAEVDVPGWLRLARRAGVIRAAL
nr:ATP-binding protein [Streptomyces sp. SID13726]